MWIRGPAQSEGEKYEEQETCTQLATYCVTRDTCVERAEIVMARHCKKCMDNLRASDEFRCGNAVRSSGRTCCAKVGSSG